MRLDKLTVKAQEAIQAAQSLADQGNHQAVEPEHLLLALLAAAGGRGGPAARQARRAPGGARAPGAGRARQAARRCEGGGRQYASARASRRVLDRAWDEAERLKDEYVSTEHLLIAIAQEKGGAAARVLAGAAA